MLTVDNRYVSPLTRAGQTMLLSFGELLTGTPEVWEDWREIYGSHTCDKRSTKVLSSLDLSFISYLPSPLLSRPFFSW